MEKVFISYKTGVPNDQEAELLYNELVKRGYRVFLDKRKFHAGISWDQAIYDNISDSDVLIVLITGDAHSPWVQREVDFALGCRVKILPVVIQAEDVPIAGKVMRDLAIVGKQYAEAFGSSKPEIRYGEIIESIPLLAKDTRDEQVQWLKQLKNKWAADDANDPLLQPAKPTRQYASYAFFPNVKHAHPCTIHITSGSIADVENIDVLVNSENVYMQMQRVFASESISKRIRLDGGKRRGRHYIEEDTIQRELNEQLFGPDGEGVPVSQGSVIVTTSGGNTSRLRKKGIRYIFHLAMVDANTDREFLVEKPTIVKECVGSCFEKVIALDDSGDPVQSIIFPVLASGNAGLDLVKSAEAILEAFKEFLESNPNSSLRHIYLAAYTLGDVQKIEQLLDADTNSLRRIP
ncbi:TIR domain-containing protein [Chloroflexota bacterium]